MIARIDGEKGKTGLQAQVNISRCFQVIGVRPHGRFPAFQKDTPGGIIHHLAWCAAGAVHLADGLLGENRGDMPLEMFNRAHMSRRGQAQAVAQPGGGIQPHQRRVEPGEVCAHGRGVFGRERACEQGVLPDFVSLSLKVSKGSVAEGRQNSQTGGVIHTGQ